ncbi:hypothetical protein [Kitasatospora sp. NPDC085464]|uniref:hypothetical protein n=1 Tax=Kitasatospora sp. NPDC085464 TaxID=3364063 RepID=UPI0037CA75D9
MSNAWTAPDTGWYRLAPGKVPEYLGEQIPDPAAKGQWTVVPLHASPLAGPRPVTMLSETTASFIHFQRGDTTMNSGGTLQGMPAPALTVPWRP